MQYQEKCTPVRCGFTLYLRQDSDITSSFSKEQRLLDSQVQYYLITSLSTYPILLDAPAFELAAAAQLNLGDLKLFSLKSQNSRIFSSILTSPNRPSQGENSTRVTHRSGHLVCKLYRLLCQCADKGLRVTTLVKRKSLLQAKLIKTDFQFTSPDTSL